MSPCVNQPLSSCPAETVPLCLNTYNLYLFLLREIGFLAQWLGRSPGMGLEHGPESVPEWGRAGDCLTQQARDTWGQGWHFLYFQRSPFQSASE